MYPFCTSYQKQHVDVDAEHDDDGDDTPMQGLANVGPLALVTASALYTAFSPQLPQVDPSR